MASFSTVRSNYVAAEYYVNDTPTRGVPAIAVRSITHHLITPLTVITDIGEARAWRWARELAAPFPAPRPRLQIARKHKSVYFKLLRSPWGEHPALRLAGRSYPTHSCWRRDVLLLFFIPLAASLLSSLPLVILGSIFLLRYNVSRFGAASERLSASSHAGFPEY